MRKRFVKLLLFKVDTQYRLLYGFSSETEQSSYPWKTFPADRKGQKLIAKAILSPSEADNFLISLTGTEPIMLCERVTLKSPQLYKREQLLYSDDEEQQAVPISEFCYLFEFWNREKLSLLSEIQNEFSADGRTRYEQTLELLEWAKCNCGIDFCIDGRRFGNYEVYYRTPENSSFEIVGSLTAEACGIDLFSTIARWTSEIFQLDQSGTPYAEITKYPLEIGEVKSYASLQEAVDALGVTSPLVPKYLPERYSSDGITIERRTTGVCIYADYTSINGSVGVRLKESTRAGQQTAEKDSNSQRVYVVRGIQHYIVDDGAQTKIVWANGNFECRICGDISEEEAIAIIDSIYKDG